MTFDELIEVLIKLRTITGNGDATVNIKFNGYHYDVYKDVHIEITVDNKLLIIEADN